MRIAAKRIILLISSCFILGGALATPVKSLYQADVKVANYSTTVRQNAIPKAMGQVLIKVSGNIAINTIPKVESQTEQAAAWVQSYNYYQQKVAGQKSLWLHVVFDARAVKDILISASQAIWGEDRPLTLVLLDINANNKQAILSNDVNNDLANSLTKDANARGLPILLPLMDLQDMSAISPSDVCQLKQQQILAAAGRYHANSVLAGCITQDGVNSWTSKWQLTINNDSFNWQIKGTSVGQILAKIVDNVVSSMSARFAVLADNSLKKDLLVKITDVDGLNQYVQVVKYFRSLDSVSAVALLDVGTDNIDLKVTVTGGAQALENAVAKDDKLAANTDDENVDLSYHWLNRG